MADKYEYGICFKEDVAAPHRWGMTEDAARQWIAGWLEDGGAPGVFSLMRRPSAQWEPVPWEDEAA